MHFLSKALEDYVTNHSEDEPEILKELSRETHLKILRPRMLSGHFQGRLLSLLVKIISPGKILEIGTYTGYSAICMAEGLSKKGSIHTIDSNEELVSIQKKYLKKSGFNEQVKLYTGDALKIIPSLDLKFDMVFIDADKPNYSNYFDLIIKKMNRGGIILSDNVLWSGKVIETIEPNDKSALALIAYNKKLKEDPRVETILLPIRDGLTISRVL